MTKCERMREEGHEDILKSPSMECYTDGDAINTGNSAYIGLVTKINVDDY